MITYEILQAYWWFLVSLLGGILVFLLGAMCFKKNKSAKTILCLIGVSMVVSTIASPIVLHQMGNFAVSLNDIEDTSAIFNSPFFNKILAPTLKLE